MYDICTIKLINFILEYNIKNVISNNDKAIYKIITILIKLKKLIKCIIVEGNQLIIIENNKNYKIICPHEYILDFLAAKCYSPVFYESLITYVKKNFNNRYKFILRNVIKIYNIKNKYYKKKIYNNFEKLNLLLSKDIIETIVIT
ncbi:hypothetical protein AMV123 [Betaentomopoxvirus amoorei]|uniref:AMV123 n=1 Tax=Amsacta moorei entomopoxvirus TaxID=28321 RepID=Q9EMS6_AMEPV|nr:hypothetical protein AMV123 [Amsacta moorei entomopoxvirus]AAG02829.1 AMV123 [Amsacta moorei entomopoxvirus]